MMRWNRRLNSPVGCHCRCSQYEQLRAASPERAMEFAGRKSLGLLCSSRSSCGAGTPSAAPASLLRLPRSPGRWRSVSAGTLEFAACARATSFLALPQSALSLAGTPSTPLSPASPQALAAAGRWQDALRAADSTAAGAPDWLLAAAARALAAPTPGPPDACNPDPALISNTEGAGSRAPDVLRPRALERQREAEGRQGADTRPGFASGPGPADSKLREAGDTAARPDAEAQGSLSGSGLGPASRPGSRPRSGGSEASAASTSAARRGQRLAWECCMRLHDKRLAAGVVLECLGAGAAVFQGLHRGFFLSPDC